MPLVSVIIPTYNRAAYLAAAIDSVRAQTLRDLEIIVVDDGSTDETRALIDAYHGGVRYVYRDRSGLIGAVRNHGIRLATSPLIAFLDADDLWEPRKLEAQLHHATQYPAAGLIYTDGWFFDDATGTNRYRLNDLVAAGSGHAGPVLLQQCFMQTSSVLVRRAALDQVGLFSEDAWAYYGEDWDLWLRIAARTEIAYIADPLVRMRLHARNVSGAIDPLEAQRISAHVIARACAFAPEVFAPVRGRALLITYCRAFELLRRMGRDDDARAVFAEAMRMDPTLTLQMLRDGANAEQATRRTLWPPVRTVH